MFNKINRDQIKKTLILGFLSALLVITSSYFGIFNDFKHTTFDLFSRLLNPDSPAEAKSHINKVVIIEIDQRSLDDVNREGISWPWPRQIYAPIIEYLSEAEAVFVDILFTEPSSYGLEDDQIFSEAIKKNSNVYLPVFLTKSFYEMSVYDELLINKISIKSKVKTAREFNSAITPIDVLKDSISSSGNVTIAPDNDGVYRRIPLFFKLNDYVIPHFLLNFLIKSETVSIKGNNIYYKNSKIPFANGKLILNYYGNVKAFNSFSASQILKSYLDVSKSKTPQISKDYFKNKVVLIGLTAPGLYDLRPTPVASVSTGIYIHATTLNNFYNNNFFKEVPDIVLFAFIIVICLVCSYFILISPSLIRNVSFFIFLLSLIVVINIVLFKLTIYLNLIDPVLSLILSFIFAVAYSYATEGKKRELTEKTLLQYMDKQVASYLLNNPSLIKSGGMKKRVTVFFADIADFTTIAEKLPPEEVANLLIKVFNLFSDKIIENRGVIDKYIGDSVMAFWGAPIESANDEINACLAAIGSFKSLDELNSEFQKNGLPVISLRVGINSGDAIVGNMGSDRVFDYTVVGDSVNLASRIESLNKHFNTKILISENTLSKTNDIFAVRSIGLIEVKGKSIHTQIYEVFDVKENIDQETTILLETYSKALAYFNDEKINEAYDNFVKIYEKYPDDGPTDFYIKRCEQLLTKKPLTNDWKTIKFDSK